MKINFWKFVLYSRNHNIWFFLFAMLILLKIPTIFYTNYYDISITETVSYLLDNPVRNIYELIVKLSIDNGSFLLLRIINILLISLTSIFVFLLTKKIYSSRVGFISTIIYTLSLSSFGPSFLEFSEEILLSPFFMLGLYSFYMIEFEEKKIYILTLTLSVIFSLLISFKGVYLILAIIFYILIARPFWVFRKNREDVSKYFILIIVITLMGLSFFIIDWVTTNKVMNENFKKIVSNYYINYIENNLLLFIPNFIHKILIIFIFHSILWFFGIKGIINFFNDKIKRAKEFYIISTIIFLGFTVLLSGLDIKLQSFIPIYPVISIIAGFQIFENVKQQKLRKTIITLILLPVIFFFLWNTKEIFVNKNTNKISYTFNKIMGEKTIDIERVSELEEIIDFIKREEASVYSYNSYLKYLGYSEKVKINFITDKKEIDPLKIKTIIINTQNKEKDNFEEVLKNYFYVKNIGNFQIWKIKE
ncbi:MAG TPA: glycosyltransferase family 39 protein [Spirochaetota bacterium]|nr:glycosyltransferase family 39 protein [Spirochaetota bacterium]HOM37636.1 glycosyltransferase family 39 protein [Spirochaetota bacterium]HPQ49393.1 glycosyltransferase family 39 protein [Spirochaetota bacterium]